MRVIGHRKQFNYLKKIAEVDKIPHALLFCGQAKLGKRTLALEWASFLLKEDIKNKIHPDFILVEPQPPEDDSAGKKEIRISQIRDLIWKLSLKPSVAPLKVAIINDCHLMNQESQGAFLKTLEEPKEKTILVLIAEHQESLLPTILSRCQIIKFYPVPKKEIEDYLEERGLSRLKIEEISGAASGLPGQAVEILLEPQKLAEIKKITGQLREAMGKDLAFRFQLAKVLAEKGDLPEILKIWQNYLRSNLFSGKNIAILKQIQNVSRLIKSTNASQRLGLEMIMLEL